MAMVVTPGVYPRHRRAYYRPRSDVLGDGDGHAGVEDVAEAYRPARRHQRRASPSAPRLGHVAEVVVVFAAGAAAATPAPVVATAAPAAAPIGGAAAPAEPARPALGRLAAATGAAGAVRARLPGAGGQPGLAGVAALDDDEAPDALLGVEDQCLAGTAAAAGHQDAVGQVGAAHPDVGGAATAVEPAVVAVVVAVTADDDEQRGAAQDRELAGHPGAPGAGAILAETGRPDGGDLDRPLGGGRHHEGLDRLVVDEGVAARPGAGGHVGDAALRHRPGRRVPLHRGAAGLAGRHPDATEGGHGGHRGPYTSVHTGNVTGAAAAATGWEPSRRPKITEVGGRPAGALPFSACPAAAT